MVLRDGCHVRVVNICYHLNVIRSPQPSLDMALQSMSRRIRVRYISREVPMLRHNSRFIDLVHCVMNYAVTVELKYDVQFLQALPSDIAPDMQQSRLIKANSLSTCFHYHGITKIFSKNNNLFTFVTEKSKQK